MCPVIPIKKTCFVLAIIDAIINFVILALYVVVWGLLMLLVGYIIGAPLRLKREVSDKEAEFYANIEILTFFLLPLILILNFVFSVVLCIGVSNNLPKLVKSYFWHGIFCNVLTILAAVLLLCVHLRADQLPLTPTGMATILLVTLTFRSLFLILVHHTHKKIVDDSMLIPLVEGAPM